MYVTLGNIFVLRKKFHYNYGDGFLNINLRNFSLKKLFHSFSSKVYGLNGYITGTIPSEDFRMFDVKSEGPHTFVALRVKLIS